MQAFFADHLPLRGMIEYGLSHGKAVRPSGAPYAAIEAGDFLILGGQGTDAMAAAFAEELIDTSEVSELLVYAPDAWRSVLAAAGLPYTVDTRWAFQHQQPQDAHLHALLQGMPEGARFLPIEGDWFTWCRKQPWTSDFVSQYTAAQYAREGLGVLLEVQGEVVAGASSYLSYPGGIEVQVETCADQQGRGYATLAAAQLLLMAHSRDLMVTWDAANEASARLARRLGYRDAGAYDICIFKTNAQ